MPTGLQDYRPALYGGIAAVELEADGVKRVPLNVDLAELQKRIVLCYTGEPQKLRHEQLGDYQARHIDGDRFIFDCFERIRDTAADMREALERGDWDAVGRAIAREWENRKQLAPGDHARHRRSDCRATAAGATAAKVCGAGAAACVQLRASSSARRSLLPLPAEVRGCSTIRSSATGCRVDNKSIAQVLAKIADLLEIKDENAFKIRAYRSAADVIATWPDAVARMDAQQLRAIPGVGEDLAAKIRELAETGSSPYHQELLAQFPPTILDLLRLQGVGPKTVAMLLDPEHLDARRSRLRQLTTPFAEGLGAKKEAQILKAIEERAKDEGRH